MNKRTLITCICISLCLLFAFSGVAYAATGESIFSLAGKYYRAAQGTVGLSEANSNTIIASYNGHNITVAMVEYNRNMNILRDEASASKHDSDLEIAEQLIANIILAEEAEKLGLSATKAEIDLMVENAIRSYSIPEGKAILDDYCAGAGISFEEYIELLREQAPNVIARQKLKNEIGKQYCEQKGIKYTHVNPPVDMIRAQEKYIAELIEQHKDDIVYYEVTQ